MIIPKEQRLGYEYRNYHHYAAIILELGTVGKILVTASILDLSNFKFQEFIMMSPIEFYLPGTYPPGTYVHKLKLGKFQGNRSFQLYYF